MVAARVPVGGQAGARPGPRGRGSRSSAAASAAAGSGAAPRAPARPTSPGARVTTGGGGTARTSTPAVTGPAPSHEAQTMVLGVVAPAPPIAVLTVTAGPDMSVSSRRRWRASGARPTTTWSWTIWGPGRSGHLAAPRAGRIARRQVRADRPGQPERHDRRRSAGDRACAGGRGPDQDRPERDPGLNHRAASPLGPIPKEPVLATDQDVRS